MPASDHGPRRSRQPHARAPHLQRTFRPTLEKLEDRSVPATFVSDLNLTTAQVLAQQIAGNTPISNVTYVGDPTQAGLLQDGLPQYGFERAVVLSTGRANALPGPNLNPFLSTAYGNPGDPVLSSFIKGAATFDAARLGFDFVATGDALRFRYRFGSDEYGNITVPGFPDLFGIFIDGTNIAFLPGTRVLVNTETVNLNVNGGFFLNNPFGSDNFDVEVNGFTTILNLRVNLNAGQRYRFEVAIADALDFIGDSAIFIEANEGVDIARANIVAERPLRWIYNPATGTYRGEITISNPSDVALRGPLYLTVANLPPGVTVVNDDTFRVSGFTNNPTTSIIAVPQGSIGPRATVYVPIELRNPLDVHLGTFYQGFDIGLVQL
jgi:hypothetical protein